jgi:hypothetical protein
MRFEGWEFPDPIQAPTQPGDRSGEYGFGGGEGLPLGSLERRIWIDFCSLAINLGRYRADVKRRGCEVTIIALLLNILPGLLTAIPGISDKIKQIVADVSGAAATVIASGVVTGPSVTTVLAAWLGVINTLKADPNLPANTLNAIAQLEKAISAALMNDVQASAAVDWSKIVVIATV